MTDIPDPTTLKAAAATAFEQKRFTEAQGAYAVLSNLFPNDPFFADRHAYCHLALEDWERGLHAWLFVISCHGPTAARLNHVAHCLIEMASYRAATDLLINHKDKLRSNPRSLVMATLAAIGSDELVLATEACLEIAELPADKTIAALDELLRRLERLSGAGNTRRISEWLDRALPVLGKKLPLLQLGLSLAASRARWRQIGRNEALGSQEPLAPAMPPQNDSAVRRKSDMAAAQALIKSAQERVAEGGGAKSAFDLLLSARADFRYLPPQYDATIGAMALRAGLVPEAISYLERATLALREPPPWMPRMLGAALLDADHAASAGRYFHHAAQAGAVMLDINAQLAMRDFRSPLLPATKIDYRHIHGMSFVDETRNLSYLSIPKNACSVLKLTFIMNSPAREAYLASKLTIHEFFPLAANSIDSEKAIASNPARILVLRDPLSRLVSCYLNKFARPIEQNQGMVQTISSTIEKVQMRLGLSRDPDRSISFAEFVAYVVKTPDAACDHHWMPQHCICGDDMLIYAHVGRFERLGETLAFLQTRYGMIPETDLTPHIKFPETHATRHDPEAADLQAWTMLPDDLRAMADGFPPTSAFYDDALREAVIERYATDARLHRDI